MLYVASIITFNVFLELLWKTTLPRSLQVGRIQDSLRKKSYIRIYLVQLRNQLNQFEMFLSGLIHGITLKTVLFQKKVVLIENHVNRESKNLDLTIQLYRCYENEAPRSCNTTIYLLWLLLLKRDMVGKVQTREQEKLQLLKCQETQGDQYW